MVIHIVGLGPGSASLLTAETSQLLASARRVVLRTRKHPALAELPGSGEWEDCDALYASGMTFDAVYEQIVGLVLARARAGDIVYAVPGHPLVAESSVATLLAAAREVSIDVVVHPAISYVDVAAVALRRDLGNVQVCNALELRIDPQRPALIGQVFDRDTAGTVKLHLLEMYPADHEVEVLRALSTPEQQSVSMPLSELDHVPWGYLDAVFVPAIAAIEDLRRFDGLHAIVCQLHAPGGCPWDREQTHESLRHYLLEESYELLEAIDSGETDRIEEELGDVLLQVLMHASVGEREGTFTLGDVTEGISRKLIRRHPHVFAGGGARTAEEVHQRWDELKRAEKPTASALEGVPLSLPALAQAQSVQGRARRSGFDWPDMQGPLDKLVEEMAEFAEAGNAREREAEFGDLLFVAAGIAQRLGLDAEQALRGATSRFRRRYEIVEHLARSRGLDMKELPIAHIVGLWEEAKSTVAGQRNPLGVSLETPPAPL